MSSVRGRKNMANVLEVKLSARLPNGDDGLGWGNSTFKYVHVFSNHKLIKELGPMPKAHAEEMKKLLDTVIELARSTT